VLDNPFNQPWNELLDACQQLNADEVGVRAEDSARAMRPFKVQHFNEVLARTWINVADGSRANTVRRSWQVTGLYPLDMSVALAREGAVASGVWANTHPDTETHTFLGTLLGKHVTPEGATCSKEGNGLLAGVRMHVDTNGLHMEMASTSSSYLGGATGPGAVLRLAMAKSVQVKATSASVVYEEIKNAKKAKNTIVQVVDGVHFGRNGNPSTLGGCAVTPAVMDACRKRYLEKEHTETSRQEKRDERDVQKVARVEAAQDVAKEVRARVLSGGDWSREFNADQIKTAANIILQPAQKFKTQPPAIAALTAWAATQTQAAPQGLAPQ